MSALHEVVAVWPHKGHAAALVRQLKYGRATTVVTELAEAMAGAAPAADLATWVPASPSRRRERGFDQGELLARAVARRLGCRARGLLRRVDDNAQTSRDLAGRLAGPVFVRRGRRPRPGSVVLLIDDVCTSGTSLRSAAAVLVAAGQVGLSASWRPARSGPKALPWPPRGPYHRGHQHPREGRNGRLHQRTACDHHAEAGGGDPREDRPARPVSRWTRLRRVHFDEARNPRIQDKEFCEVVLKGNGHHLRCKVHAPDPFTAIDLAEAKLERQIRKLRTKLQRRHHGTGATIRNGDGRFDVGSTAVADPTDADEEVDDGFPQIVKTKRFHLGPLTPKRRW